MSSLKKLAAKINSMSLRERQILLAGVVLIVPILFWGTFLDGQIQRQHKIEKSTHAKNLEITKLKGLIQNKANDRTVEVGASQASSLRREIGGLRAALSASDKTLVAAASMPQLFDRIVTLRGPLRLVAVKTLPAKSSTRDVAGNSSPTSDVILQHGIQITVRGDVPELLLYLQRLEALPSPLVWDKVSLQQVAGSSSILTMNVHTLSLDSSWVSF
jgi:MSHA biogenesis protein MshJ